MNAVLVMLVAVISAGAVALVVLIAKILELWTTHAL